MRSLLFVTQENPFLQRSGAQLRDLSLIRALRTMIHVDVLSLDNQSAGKNLPKDELFFRTEPKAQKPLWRRALSPFLPYVLNEFDPWFEQYLEVNRNKYDAVWFSKLSLGKYARLARSLGYFVILDEHNVESLYLLESLKERGPLQPEKIKARFLKTIEKRFCNDAHWICCTSERDAIGLKQIGVDKKPFVVPNLIDLQRFSNLARKPEHLLFSGTLDYHPNYTGLIWFLEKAWPRVRDTESLIIAGARPSSDLKKLVNEKGATLIDSPSDMTPYFMNAQALIVPVFSGGGTRLKILEAMAAKVPVISTKKGAEGLAAVAGVHYLLAETPEDFARQIQFLRNDQETAQKMVDIAHSFVSDFHDWRGWGQKIVDELNSYQSSK